MKIKCFILMMVTISSFSQKELAYNQPQFDNDSCCWRKLSRLGNHEAGANLIVAYLKKGNPQNTHALNWHAAQLFAKAQNNKMALRYINKTQNIGYWFFGGDDGKSWYWYTNGTKAFIQRDREKLNRIINKWNNTLPQNRNYNQLLSLSKNWDKTYDDALKE